MQNSYVNALKKAYKIVSGENYNDSNLIIYLGFSEILWTITACFEDSALKRKPNRGINRGERPMLLNREY